MFFPRIQLETKTVHKHRERYEPTACQPLQKTRSSSRSRKGCSVYHELGGVTASSIGTFGLKSSIFETAAPVEVVRLKIPRGGGMILDLSRKLLLLSGFGLESLMLDDGGLMVAVAIANLICSDSSTGQLMSFSAGYYQLAFITTRPPYSAKNSIMPHYSATLQKGPIFRKITKDTHSSTI